MIPAETLERAKRVCDAIPADCDPDYESITVGIIAEALMQERSRCISLMKEYIAKRHSKGDGLMAFEMEVYLRNSASGASS